MTITILLLGIILGFLIAFFIFFLTSKFNPQIEKFLQKPVFKPKVGKAYIAGLSEEEQNYKDNLPEKII